MTGFDPSENDFESFENEYYEDEVKLTFLEQVLGIIIAPRETLRILAENPRFRFPAILMVVSVLLYNLARFEPFKETIKFIVGKNRADMSSEQLIGIADKWAFTGVFLMPVFTILGWVISSIILFLIIKFLNGKTNLPKVAIIVGNSFLVVVIYYFISAIISIISKNYLLSASLATVTNLLFPELKGSFLYGLFRGIDIFGLWQCWIIASGISAITNFGTGKSVFTVATAYLILIFISSGTLMYLN